LSNAADSTRARTTSHGGSKLDVPYGGPGLTVVKVKNLEARGPLHGYRIAGRSEQIDDLSDYVVGSD
jgi:hypothetical protein